MSAAQSYPAVSVRQLRLQLIDGPMIAKLHAQTEAMWSAYNSFNSALWHLDRSLTELCEPDEPHKTFWEDQQRDWKYIHEDWSES